MPRHIMYDLPMHSHKRHVEFLQGLGVRPIRPASAPAAQAGQGGAGTAVKAEHGRPAGNGFGRHLLPAPDMLVRKNPLSLPIVQRLNKQADKVISCEGAVQGWGLGLRCCDRVFSS